MSLPGRILTRYILITFARYYALALAGFISLYIVIELFDKMRQILDQKIGAMMMARYFFFKLPLILSQISPLAVLIAVLLAMGELAKAGEVTAIKSSGISVKRFTYPILLAGIVFTILMFLNSEFVLPGANKRTNAIEEHVMKMNPIGATFDNNKVWFRQKGVIYKVGFIDFATKSLKGTTLFFFDDSFHLTKRLDSEVATFDGKLWHFKNGKFVNFAKGKIRQAPVKDYIAKLGFGFNDFTVIKNRTTEMNLFELAAYVSKTKAEGYDVGYYMVDLYDKIAFPLATLIMTLIGIPFAASNLRRGGSLKGIGIALGLGLGYWVLFAIGNIVGYNGIVPPFFASWTANIIFAVVIPFKYAKIEW